MDQNAGGLELRIGITGHRSLKNDNVWGWVRKAISDVLSQAGRPLIGMSSLAAGSDQLFAELVLSQGGNLEVVIPFEGYERTFDSPSNLDRYRELLAKAARVETIAGPRQDDEAYLEAGRRIVNLSQSLIAVWDGLPARGWGGTAQVVALAREAGRPVIEINPNTHTVTDLGFA